MKGYYLEGKLHDNKMLFVPGRFVFLEDVIDDKFDFIFTRDCLPKPILEQHKPLLYNHLEYYFKAAVLLDSAVEEFSRNFSYENCGSGVRCFSKAMVLFLETKKKLGKK